jgi:hypothetical protein
MFIAGSAYHAFPERVVIRPLLTPVKGRGHCNRSCYFTVEFSSAPLMIGEEHVVDEGIADLRI